MNRTRSPLSSLALAASVATLSAPGAAHAADAGPTARSSAPAASALAPARAPDAAVIARLKTADGHRFDFVDEGEDVGIAEISPNGKRSKLIEMIGTAKASPLEVYLALAGRDADAPLALRRAHERFARANGRKSAAVDIATLNLASFAASSVVEDYEPDQCAYNASWNPGQSEFTWAWYWTIGNSKDFTAQQTYDNTDIGGTAGKYWYAGTSRERWLAACNGNYIFGFQDFQFRAQYRNSAGSWVNAYITQIEPDFSVRYYSSSSPQRWRVQLREMSFNVFPARDYAVAVAGNAPFGLAP